MSVTSLSWEVVLASSKSMVPVTQRHEPTQTAMQMSEHHRLALTLYRLKVTTFLDACFLVTDDELDDFTDCHEDDREGYAHTDAEVDPVPPENFFP